MLPSPSSSPLPVHVLEDCTNTSSTPLRKLSFFPPTPPDDLRKNKRPFVEPEEPHKRVKLATKLEVSNVTDSEDECERDYSMVRARARRRTAFNIHSDFMAMSASQLRRQELSTLPILQSFVSSHQFDVFKCQSIDVDGYLTPPYACSYTNGAKLGDEPLLAVATEQGSVHILKTSSRKTWDTEPLKTTLQPHNNGIFDLKWDMSDTFIATASGDQSARITCIEKNVTTLILGGHTSTVKCLAWDPNHRDLIATGGRDGAVRLWDLRVSEERDTDEPGVIGPVIVIPRTHEDIAPGKPRRAKNIPKPRSVTGMLYPESDPYGIVTSGSFDGILKYWDLRVPTTARKSKSAKPKIPNAIYTTSIDPTVHSGSRRPRGIISLALGTGPTTGLAFALGADSRIHTYSLPSLDARSFSYKNDNMRTDSFYLGLSMSPCGRWLASGGSGSVGSNFIFDVSNACKTTSSANTPSNGVELVGELGEKGAVDWAQNLLSTCADDGTVRLWRPNIETYRACQEDPVAMKWNWAWAK